MTEMDQSALTEIANIVINACLDDLAKGGRGELGSAPPAVVRGTLATILRGAQDQSADAVTIGLKLVFSLAEADIGAELLFIIAAERFADFWRAAVRDIRIPVPAHG
jgi:CheY-specific phosphatase CheX